MDQSASYFRLNASRCRELAATAITPAARDILASLAVDYDHKAVTLESVEATQGQRRPAFKWGLDNPTTQSSRSARA